MKLWSDSWTNGERIPARFACGRLDEAAGTAFSDNLNPHLAWSDLPAGTRSLVLICHDFDVPSRGDDVNQAGREIPADLPRVDFFHWLLVDVPASAGAIAAQLLVGVTHVQACTDVDLDGLVERRAGQRLDERHRLGGRVLTLAIDLAACLEIGLSALRQRRLPCSVPCRR